MTEREAIRDNICSFLACEADDICGIEAMQQGLNNHSFRFCCKGEKYVYRHPGVNASDVIDRKKEAIALKTAKRLGIDDTLLYIDDEAGWKISRYIEVTEPFDFSNERHIAMLAEHIRVLHDEKIHTGFEFDYETEADTLFALIEKQDKKAFNRILPEREKMIPVFERINRDAWPKCMCHNDLYEPNLLVEGDRLHIIDWEFAGDSDIGYDICKLFCVNDSDDDTTDKRLRMYYGGEVPEGAKAHLTANAAAIYYYWYIWAVYAAYNGENVAGYMPVWYEKMNRFRDKAIACF